MSTSEPKIALIVVSLGSFPEPASAPITKIVSAGIVTASPQVAAVIAIVPT